MHLIEFKSNSSNNYLWHDHFKLSMLDVRLLVGNRETKKKNFTILESEF